MTCCEDVHLPPRCRCRRTEKLRTLVASSRPVAEGLTSFDYLQDGECVEERVYWTAAVLHDFRPRTEEGITYGVEQCSG
jgi:hypothetical protein